LLLGVCPSCALWCWHCIAADWSFNCSIRWFSLWCIPFLEWW
jgi:hypothetical protein